MNDDDKTITFPKKRREAGEQDRVLTVVRPFTCYHGKWIIDPDKAEVECGICHEKMNPIVVLEALARQETKFHELHARYQEELKYLEERKRVQCSHCGKYTTINRR